MKKNTTRSTKGAKTTVNEKEISISPIDLQKSLELMKHRKCNCSIHTTMQYLMHYEPETNGTEEAPLQNAAQKQNDQNKNQTT
jgi:hypothetical protein